MSRCVAILAGGESRRMGADKAALRIGGITWLERIARAARDAGASVLVVGRSAPASGAIDGVRFVTDALAGLGPIGGLATALDAAPEGRVAAVACDMPNLTASAFTWLFDEADARAVGDGLVTSHDGVVEPLFAVYTARCRPLVARQIAAGRRSMRALVDAGSFIRAEAPHAIRAALVNVNTPAELAAYAGASVEGGAP